MKLAIRTFTLKRNTDRSKHINSVWELPRDMQYEACGYYIADLCEVLIAL